MLNHRDWKRPLSRACPAFCSVLPIEHAYPPSVVIEHYVLPIVRAHGYWKCRRSDVLRLRANSMNGAGPIAGIAVERAGDITGRDDLDQLSLLNLRKLQVFEEDGLLHPTKRWCSACWKKDDDRNGRYDRKLWTLSVVEVCPSHRTVLVERCFGCGQMQPVLGRDVRVGTCAHCGKDLCSGVTAISRQKGSDGERQLWYAEQAAQFILGVDLCPVYQIDDEALAAARTQGFKHLERHLVALMGSRHCSVRRVNAWSKRPSSINLETLFSVLWEARWPVLQLFPQSVSKYLEAVHRDFAPVEEAT